MPYLLFTDGGSRNNPGPAAVGFVIYKDDEILHEYSKYIGVRTNNEAEYEALISGLEKCIELGISDITAHLDSELVVKQLQGLYKVKNEKMKKYYTKVDSLKNEFNSIQFKHIKRELNKKADKLVNEALDLNAKES